MQSVSFAEEENLKTESEAKPLAIEIPAQQSKLADVVTKSILYQWNIIRSKHPSSKLHWNIIKYIFKQSYCKY